MTIVIIGLLIMLVIILTSLMRFIKELDILANRIDSLVGQNMKIYDEIEDVENELKDMKGYLTKKSDTKTNL